MMVKFIKRGTKWALASDSYLREGELVDVSTSKGAKAVRVGKQLEKPQGVQRRGSYVYEVQ